MPRRFLKRIMPDHNTMREHPRLRKFGKRLTEPRLWHLNKRSVSGGTALGLFVAFIPMPGQMLLAAALSIFFRVNLPISMMGVWVTNPLTFAPIFFYVYKVGAWVLQEPMGQYAFTFSWEWFSLEFLSIWKPLLLGCFICGTLAAIAGMLLVRLIWRLSVMYSWMQRQHRKNCSRR